jgi:redox-sensitive bicupin YhaK (pirin superfamily)
MSAGTGVLHSEFNHAPKQHTHFLQVWILPTEKNLAPGYEQKSFATDLATQGWVRVLSPDGAGGTVRIHQDVNLDISFLKLQWSAGSEFLFFDLPK